MTGESSAGTPQIVLYTKPGCHLCDEAKAVLQGLRETLAFELQEIDITADPALSEAFSNEIPVGYIDGRKIFKYRIDPALIRRRLQRRRGWLSGRWFSAPKG